MSFSNTFILCLSFAGMVFFGSCTRISDAGNNTIIRSLQQKTGHVFSSSSSNYEIRLKIQERTFYDLFENEIRMSYIIEISKPISGRDSIVYLSLLDKEGFEIEKFNIGRIAKGYSGTLKGSFAISSKKCSKISGADIELYVK